MNQLQNQRVAFLVDAENAEGNANNNYGAQVDYRKLLQEVAPRKLVRAVYFIPHYKLRRGQKQILSSWGFEIVTPHKDADPWLIFNAVSLADKIDTLILVSGDSHFIPLFEYMKYKGVRTELWMWKNRSTSSILINAADYFKPLNAAFLLKKHSNNIITFNSKRR